MAKNIAAAKKTASKKAPVKTVKTRAPRTPAVKKADIRQKYKIHEVLRGLLHELNMTEAELSRRAGVPQPTLHRILAGGTTSPGSKTLIPLANFFCVSINQLIGVDPLPEKRVQGQFNPNIVGWSPVPVLSWDDAADLKKFFSEVQKKSWEKWTSTDVQVGEEAFALIVEKPMATDDFPTGTIMVFETASKANSGDFVIVKIEGNKSVVLRQLISDGDQKYLRPLHPDFPTTPFHKDQHTIIGLLRQSRKDFSRHTG